jgi:hypothetical protein
MQPPLQGGGVTHGAECAPARQSRNALGSREGGPGNMTAGGVTQKSVATPPLPLPSPSDFEQSQKQAPGRALGRAPHLSSTELPQLARASRPRSPGVRFVPPPPHPKESSSGP